MTEKLACELCDNTTAFPKCCGKIMQIQGDKLICAKCNTVRDVPLCCGNQMLLAQL